MNRTIAGSYERARYCINPFPSSSRPVYFSRFGLLPVLDCTAPKAAYLTLCVVPPLCPVTAVVLVTWSWWKNNRPDASSANQAAFFLYASVTCAA